MSKCPGKTSFRLHADSVRARILLWYTIITALLRCPSSLDDLTQHSPQLCKPYLNARLYLAPYTEPYYSAYAAPHVEKVLPYFEKANKKIFVPVTSHSQQYYTTVLAPKVEQAVDFSRGKWNSVVKPQVDTAQTEARKQYDSNLAPHVDNASAAAAPYVTASRENAYQVYSKHILPTYGSIQPYFQKAYEFSYIAIVEIGLTYTQQAWTSVVIFFDRTLWPKLRILYGKNVEPQLVRISERLGRYRDGNKIQAVLDDIDSASSISTTVSPTSSISSSAVSSASDSAPTSTHSSTSEQDVQKIRSKIESDLKNWQDKFTKAAEKGLEDLEERIQIITDRQIESRVDGTGQAMLIQLEETAGSEEEKLKRKITSIVQSVSEDAKEEVLIAAEDELSKATRAAGLSVKVKGQTLRTWKESLDQETLSLVSNAKKSTLEVIDNIRDLGLQEIGMKWANMEGATYKDWSRYHEAKKSFDEWHKKLDSVTTDHLGVRQSAQAGEDLEARGMMIAEKAAKELSRLKEVGRWKITAKDDSSDFSTRYVPAAAARGAQQVMDAASSISEQVAESSQETTKPILSVASQKASEAVSIVFDKGSEDIAGTSQERSESIVSVIKDEAGNLASDANEAVVGTSIPVHQSVTSRVSEKADAATTAISEAVAGSSTLTTENTSSNAGTYSSGVSSVVSQASQKVLGGAMAQEVKGQKPIIDDIVDEGATYSEKMQSLVDQAGDEYAEATRVISEAILGATQTQGTAESVTSFASEKWAEAIRA